MSQPLLSYGLITPARNEAAFIEQTIQAVAAQTFLPRRYVIVSDGSTDGTEEIAERYAAVHPWIKLLRMPPRPERHFAGKAHAFNAGRPILEAAGCDIIGNLDADVTFRPDFFALLIPRFSEFPSLGVAGTPYVEAGQVASSSPYAHRFANLRHVSGMCQLFRRECLDDIGGYLPVKGGAIDWIAVTTARMKGWETRTFPGQTYVHHRAMGTASAGILRARFHYGVKAYYVGGHPAWELLRGLFSMRRRPFILGGLAFIAGYLSSLVTRAPRAVSAELIAFHRGEQMARLRGLSSRLRKS